MPFAINEDRMNDPSMKVLDLQNPPMKTIPHYEYPRAVYLHPTDKTKEHRVRIVGDKVEEAAAVKQGYKLKPHVPVAPPDPAIEAGEFEVA